MSKTELEAPMLYSSSNLIRICVILGWCFFTCIQWHVVNLYKKIRKNIWNFGSTVARKGTHLNAGHWQKFARCNISHIRTFTLVYEVDNFRHTRLQNQKCVEISLLLKLATYETNIRLLYLYDHLCAFIARKHCDIKPLV